MAAYAALVSLMHTINQIHNHPLPPIPLDESQIRSLTETISFLQAFLEKTTYNSDDLEGRIAEAAYAVEDIIESRIVDEILDHPEPIDLFYEGLQRLIEDMDLIKTEVPTTITQPRNETPGPSLLRPPSPRQNTMVGFEKEKNEITDKLTGSKTSLQIIPIVGMGGIGKTTLAKTIYESSRIKNRFVVLAWITLSQNYTAKEFFSRLLVCLDSTTESLVINNMSEIELGDMLQKSLYKRRYLIVLDDMRSSETWKSVNYVFREDDNGSRIIVTSRMSSMVASEITGDSCVEMPLLDEETSWDLLQANVDCPDELKSVAKSIVKSCKGLPLSIVVVAGLLSKSRPNREYWERIAESLSSVVNSENDEQCLKILHTSYNELPVHLKPCFLYMGVYPEGREINVPCLMRLWAAEGFLKPDASRSSEEVAEEYFNELIGRNLVKVSQRKISGKVQCCTIHDLLMDVCVREAERHKFIFATIKKDDISQEVVNVQRRVVIHEGTSPEVIDDFTYAGVNVRSFLYQSSRQPRSFGFRLSRVWSGVNVSLDFACRCLVNCRYLNSLNIPDRKLYSYSSSLCLLWNLQTVHVKRVPHGTVLFDIWKMPRLAHAKFESIRLPEPNVGDEDEFVLGNLKTLSAVSGFKCGEEVVRRMPNIRRLGLFYDEKIEDWPSYGLENFGRLLKLGSLTCHFSSRSEVNRSDLLEHLAFPDSLKKLTLVNTRLRWEDLSASVGSLPNLVALKLHVNSFEGPEWETVEGQFCRLKFLEISHCVDLENWWTDRSHFSVLERLSLRFLGKLTEIPCDVGEITTLKSIEVDRCSSSAVNSAKNILTEQEDVFEEDECVQVRVVIWDNDDTDVESLQCPNFRVDLRKCPGGSRD